MSQRISKSVSLTSEEGDEPFGLVAALANVAGRIFGCWHRDMSRPFTMEGETYRVCLCCGAHRRFIPEHWETTGRYYRTTVSINQKHVHEHEKSDQRYEEARETVSATLVA